MGSLTCDFFESHRLFNPGHPVAALGCARDFGSRLGRRESASRWV